MSPPNSNEYLISLAVVVTHDLGVVLATLFYLTIKMTYIDHKPVQGLKKRVTVRIRSYLFLLPPTL